MVLRKPSFKTKIFLLKTLTVLKTVKGVGPLEASKIFRSHRAKKKGNWDHSAPECLKKN